MSYNSHAMTGFNCSWAFVVGINQYANGIAPLQTAVNDAEALAQLLEDDHGYQVQRLLNQSATLSQLTHLLKTLSSKVGADDRLLFYFAGHGVALESDDGPAGYLIPQDACPNNPTTFLPMRELHDALTALPCRHLLAILDCCFSGAFRWSSLRDVIVYSEVVYQERYDRFIQDPAWQVITSTAYDQEALDILQDTRAPEVTNHHSPFAKALLDALQGGADLFPPSENGRPGDGMITATELYLYLRDHVELARKAHYKRQTPGLWPLRKHDKGEYIFLVPGHELNLPPAPELNPANNPYRGLAAFETGHAELFFGREQLIQTLHDFVTEHPLTVVLGASGTGKSSLVKAGLIPRLQNEGEPGWLIFPASQSGELSTSQSRESPVIRPGEAPLKALARAILSIKGAGEHIAEVESLSQVFIQSPEKLVGILLEWSQRYPGKRLLLVIDQFEELITLCRSESERDTFLNLLKLVLNSETIQGRVVLTLRSDFEPQFLDSPLKPLWREARFVIPPMTQDELRQAIEGPAAERVLYFEPPGLVDQLINEVVQMPGALPLLSFTLSELYIKYLERRSDNRTLTQEDYQKLNGVAGSLTQRATQEYEHLVQQDPAYARTIKRVMLRMVAIEGGELTRRRVLHFELEYPDLVENERVKTVIQRLTGARLLVEGQEPEGESYVEPAHDALVQGWDKLKQWKDQEQESLAIRGLLAPVAREWDKRQQPVGLLWNANPRLDLLKQSLESPDYWLNQLETKFIQRSVQRRRNNRLIRAGAIATFLTGLSIASIIAFWQQTEAERRGVENLAALSEARLQLHNQLGAVIAGIKAGEQIEQMNAGLSGLFQRSVQPDVWTITDFKATTSLYQALFKLNEQNRLEGHSNRVSDIVFSPPCLNSEQLIASASYDGTVKLWSLGGALKSTLAHDNTAQQYVTSVSFSSDCQLLISGGFDGKAKLWNQDGTLVKELSNDGFITDVQFSPSGQQFATVHYGSTEAEQQVKLWSRDGTLLRIFQAKTHEFSRVRFNPNGTMIALAGREDITLWNLDGQLIHTFNVHNAPVMSISFNRGGNLVASASQNGTIEIWSLDGQPLYIHSNLHRGTVNDISFNPSDQHDQMIASVGEDNTIKLWNLVDRTFENERIDLKPVATFEGHGEAVTSLSFNADGKIIATASQDNTVRLWNVDESVRSSILRIWKSDSYNRRAIFSNDAKTIALLRQDGKAELWNFSSGEKKLLGEPDEFIVGASFSSDGKTIASISQNSAEITLRNLEGEIIRTLQDLTLEAEVGSLRRIDFSADGKTIAVADSDNAVKLWNLDSASFITLNPDAGSVNCLKFSPDGKVLATASDNNTIKLWNLEGQLLKQLEGYSQFDQTLRFSPDGKLLSFLTSKDDKRTIVLWNFENRKLIRLDGHTQPVTSISFSPDGITIASTSRDHTVRLWSITGQKLRILTGHTDWVDGVIFHPDNQILASFSNITNETSSVDSEIKLWSTDGREIATLNNSLGSSMLGITFAENNTLIAADEEGESSLLTWTLNREQLLKLSCQQLSNYLKYNDNLQQDDRDTCNKYLVDYGLSSATVGGASHPQP